MSNQVERNITLDYFKIVLSILVLIIHLPINPLDKSLFHVIYNVYFIEGISRIAVPCFFIVSGYFIKIENFESVKKYLKKILVIYITWTLFYFSMYDAYNFRALLLTFLGGFRHLWYLAALIQGMIVVYLLNRILKANIVLLVIVSFVLFAIGYILQFKYQNPSLFDVYKFRNFLFSAIPFISLGLFLRTIDIKKYKKIILLGSIISFILFLYEVYCVDIFVSSNKIGLYRDFYLSLFFLCPLLFATILNYSKFNGTKSDISYLSGGIYFIHIFIIKLCSTLFDESLYIVPTVIILSALFAYMVIYANKSLKIFL